MKMDFRKLFLLSLISACSNLESVERKAAFFNSTQQYDSAIFYYKKLINERPNVPDYYFETGLMFFRKREYDSTIYYLMDAIRNGDRRSQTFFLLGKSDRAIDGIDSEVWFETAVEMDSNFQEAYYYSGLVNAEEFELEDAFVYINRAIELDNSDYLSYHVRSKLYQSEGYFNYEKSLDDINQAILLKDSSVFRKIRATALYNLGDTLAALQEINKALQFDTALIDVRLLRAVIYFELNERSLACNEIETIQELSPDVDVDVYLELCDQPELSLDEYLAR